MSDTNSQGKPFKALKAAEKQQAIYELCQEILAKLSAETPAQPEQANENADNPSSDNSSGS